MIQRQAFEVGKMAEGLEEDGAGGGGLLAFEEELGQGEGGALTSQGLRRASKESACSTGRRGRCASDAPLSSRRGG